MHFENRESFAVRRIAFVIHPFFTYLLIRNDSISVRVIIAMMIQMVGRPNTTPIGQDREISSDLRSFAFLSAAVHAQVCRLFCVVYMPVFGLVQARPWFRSSMMISSFAGISKIFCATEVASATRPYVKMHNILLRML